MIAREESEGIVELSKRPGTSRVVGFVYLLYFLTAIGGQFLIKGIVVSSDPTATANNILAHEALFQWGSAIGLIGTIVYIALTALLYDLFKPVSSSISFMAASFSLVGCAVQAAGYLLQIAPLVILQGNSFLTVFNGDQLHALALLFLKLHTQSSYLELVFFGFFDILIGYLAFKSLFLPRILGILMVLAGLGWLTCVAPTFASHLSPYIEILGFVGELLLMLWFLVMGVKAQKVQ